MNAAEIYKRIEQRQEYLDKKVRELRDREQYDLAEKYAYASAELECIRHFIAEGMRWNVSIRRWTGSPSPISS